MRRLALLATLCYALPLAAQQPAITNADYARAERFLAQSTFPLMLGGGVRPNWLADGRFWYRNTFAQGSEYILIDPIKKTRTRLFDPTKLAAALSAAADTTYEAFRLP